MKIVRTSDSLESSKHYNLVIFCLLTKEKNKCGSIFLNNSTDGINTF